jgi:hypothetical protein
MTEASLQFHIEANDYLGTLATVLDLVRQDLARRKYHRHAETLTRLRDDLVYLQRSHRIEKGETPGSLSAKSRRTRRPHPFILSTYCPFLEGTGAIYGDR